MDAVRAHVDASASPARPGDETECTRCMYASKTLNLLTTVDFQFALFHQNVDFFCGVPWDIVFLSFLLFLINLFSFIVSPTVV